MKHHVVAIWIQSTKRDPKGTAFYHEVPLDLKDGPTSKLLLLILKYPI